MENVPIIDIAGLRTGDAKATSEVAGHIYDACTTIGFFYVVGHGVPNAVIDAAFTASKTFFDQLIECKREAAVNEVYHGFTEMKVDELWGTRNIAPFETFAFGAPYAPEELSKLPAGSFLGPNVWPKIAGFENTMTAYFNAVTSSSQDVLRAMAIGLNQDPDFFTRRFQRRSSVCTMLHYPPLPSDAGDSWVSSTPHTDADCITFLAQDSNGGLEVQTRDGGNWIAVPPTPYSFVCNIGDLMARWTNDHFTSTLHRVINRSGRERFSIATFNNPDPEAVIDPRDMDDSLGESCYPPITAGDYMTEYMRQIYAANQAATA